MMSFTNEKKKEENFSLKVLVEAPYLWGCRVRNEIEIYADFQEKFGTTTVGLSSRDSVQHWVFIISVGLMGKIFFPAMVVPFDQRGFSSICRWVFQHE